MRGCKVPRGFVAFSGPQNKSTQYTRTHTYTHSLTHTQTHTHTGSAGHSTVETGKKDSHQIKLPWK